MSSETPTVSTEDYKTVSPVLFLIFNRPDTTRQVFESIRKAKPPRLYVAADGPRPDRPGENEKCQKTRTIATDIDWDCETKTLFRDENLGCGRAVSEAITWFFDHEETGIILEDDCLPEPSFFRFMDELLEKYRDDGRVAVVSGDNFQTEPRRDDRSYYFSLFNHVWGWGSWRRAWNAYDHAMKDWPAIRDQGWLADVLGSSSAAQSWAQNFEETWNGNIDTWDYQWTFSVWREGMVSILPEVNLVRNIGFGEDATHTRGSNEGDVSSRTAAISFPLRHPRHMIVDRRADDFTIKTRFRTRSLARRVVNKAIRVIKGAFQ